MNSKSYKQFSYNYNYNYDYKLQICQIRSAYAYSPLRSTVTITSLQPQYLQPRFDSLLYAIQQARKECHKPQVANSFK